ncbi:MAG: hypothetical protein GF418_17660 [Chitinivibrionales bacterium]|nr:hypothetical protein [Chitinivibrionales bacterium]MBD3397449.1 hypothetical protein [Chitinivibrionales bacterium]
MGRGGQLGHLQRARGPVPRPDRARAGIRSGPAGKQGARRNPFRLLWAPQILGKAITARRHPVPPRATNTRRCAGRNRDKKEGCMSQVMNGSRVKLHLKETLRDGTLVATTAGKQPVEVTVGQDNTFDELQKALLGMDEGDTRQVLIPSDKAYGPFREDLIFELEKSKVPDDIELQRGKKLKANFRTGQSRQVTVVDVGEANVTLDANHPLAGKDLVLDLRVVEIVA